jgi:hypothetical protein
MVVETDLRNQILENFCGIALRHARSALVRAPGLLGDVLIVFEQRFCRQSRGLKNWAVSAFGNDGRCFRPSPSSFSSRKCSASCSNRYMLNSESG